MPRHARRALPGWLVLTFLLLSTLLYGRTALAQCGANLPGDGANPAGRPRIGLVLSGGGARGYAHIGVLKALERMHVPIDCIAATSMGAVVGGLYASGLSADELDARLSKINLSDIVFDRNERAQLPQTLREDDFQYPIGISAGFGDGKVKLPVGLVQGNKLLTLLQDWTSTWPGDVDFNALPIPFRTIATDLGTGAPVVLGHGSLPRAIRASVAVPGLFAPFPVDGRTLVDGGLVSNLPVQMARDMGADIVIAVDISAKPEGQPTDSMTAIMWQTTTIMGGAIAANELKGADVVIRPRLPYVKSWDFTARNDAMLEGERAAQAALVAIKQKMGR